MFTDLSTPEKRAEAAYSLPRILEYASEGNPFYYGLFNEITTALTFRAMCPWMWWQTDTP